MVLEKRPKCSLQLVKIGRNPCQLPTGPGSFVRHYTKGMDQLDDPRAKRGGTNREGTMAGRRQM